MQQPGLERDDERGWRYLIVNADDFGLSAGVNRGVIEGCDCGIVTSASLMARWPAAEEAANLARSMPSLSVGLHLDLGEWVYRRHAWELSYIVVSTDDARAVTDEAERQLAAFRRLMGRDPTHIDSHQHVHQDEPTRSVLIELAARLQVPLRHLSPGISYCGDFYGQTGKGVPLSDAITPTAMLRVLAELQPGVTELACHPAAANDAVTTYLREREHELRTLCDPTVREAVRDMKIQLLAFSDLAWQGGPEHSGWRPRGSGSRPDSLPSEIGVSGPTPL
jgi:chitin disaccharide deacetylase